MAVTTAKAVGTPKEWVCEVHEITWGDAADVTVELSTDLSVIYKYDVAPMYGADAGHTEEDMGLLELDETVAADGSITVSSGAVTINRIAASADGTLATQNSQVTLWGKS
jgi:hypothetical protein